MSVQVVEKTVLVEVIRHSETGLLLAMSEDMKGLYVHGRTIEEIDERLPQAIRSLLEADGVKAVRVRPIESVDAASGSDAWFPQQRRFQFQEAA